MRRRIAKLTHNAQADATVHRCAANKRNQGSFSKSGDKHDQHVPTFYRYLIRDGILLLAVLFDPFRCSKRVH